MKRIAICILLTVFLSCKEEPVSTSILGNAFGTTYSVVYDGSNNFQKSFDSLIAVVNQSMSTYQEDSNISKVNRNESNVVDSHFKTVFMASKKIHQLTDGVFDPTVGAVVNAWDFGPGGKIQSLDSLKIDSLMRSVGLYKVKINGLEVIKENPDTFLDFNAIAKGYGVDLISEFLEAKHIENYLVEIGGEIRCKGYNTQKGKTWMIGIDTPNFEGIRESPLKAISLENAAMATSGTYRKFKLDDYGNRYAHIINTRTGYPSKTNVLSVSVIASDCMTADAFATALQAMRMDKIKAFVKKMPELKAFVIFENEENELETLSLNGFPQQ